MGRDFQREKVNRTRYESYICSWLFCFLFFSIAYVPYTPLGRASAISRPVRKVITEKLFHFFIQTLFKALFTSLSPSTSKVLSSFFITFTHFPPSPTRVCNTSGILRLCGCSFSVLKVQPEHFSSSPSSFSSYFLSSFYRACIACKIIPYLETIEQMTRALELFGVV